MTRRLRQEAGMGLIEVVISLAVINVALLAMVAAMNGGAMSIFRATRVSSAAVVAEKQMELYRSLLHANIGLSASLVASAGSDSVHTSLGSEWNGGTQVVPANGWCSTSKPECTPIQSAVTGPDGRTYRIDSYVRSVTPASGRAVKRVTVSVRRGDITNAPVLTQLQSNFDPATGCIANDPSYPC